MPLPTRYPPLHPSAPHLLHGGDYNPEQWSHIPGVFEEDLRLFRLAHCNSASVAIFSWVSLEPEEGRFEFAWLDRVLDGLHSAGVHVLLATPTGAKPAWMSAKYPEIRRVAPNGLRDAHHTRHNHCLTSPVYRDKAAIINTKLAERYAKHPAVVLWHLSNEYGGYCYCPLCWAAFQKWLQARYGTLDALNQAWWTRFWSHTYTAWSQIDFFDTSVHGLTLDWRRFMTDQCVDFMRHEVAALRAGGATQGVTTNMMGTYVEYNYQKFGPHFDVVSWDSYPCWHGDQPDWHTAAQVAFQHDIYRAMKGGKPWLLMETTPSQVNWQPVSPLRRPGVHRLNCLQAVAHGAESACVFQWRKSRGATEKYHGAVVDHAGHEHTRVFRDVAALGRDLEKLSSAGIIGTTTRPQVAVIYDWEVRWAIDGEQGPRNVNKDYQPTCEAQYREFWKRGIPVDVIDSMADYAPYRLIVAPMLHMVRPGVAERLTQFVEAGGTLVLTYFSGMVDEHDLCFLGGFPGPLRKVAGIWTEETDVLVDSHPQTVVPAAGNPLGLAGAYSARHYCDLIHAETATVLATYGRDFYAGRPALTVNPFGKGRAYYIASRNDDRFHHDFYAALVRDLDLRPPLDAALPEGVSVQARGDGKQQFIFVMNFTPEAQNVQLNSGTYRDVLADQPASGVLKLEPYGAVVLA